MTGGPVKANVMLLLAAMIWGFAFVAQRIGMDHVGPFTFNGIRFALGAMVLLPLFRRSGRGRITSEMSPGRKVTGSIALGVLLFLGANLQQTGLVYTTAGKAGFITGLYVVFVPLLGLFIGHKTRVNAWIGAVLAAWGLYYLCITGPLALQKGDFLVFLGAIVWAVHVQLIGWLTVRMNSLKLAMAQFMICAGLSLATAVIVEPITLTGIIGAAPAMAYAGFLSVGVAYTLQVMAQQNAHPTHAAIILSLEAAFALLGGWMILNETLSSQGLLGCGLMFIGMIVSQVAPRRKRAHDHIPEKLPV